MHVEAMESGIDGQSLLGELCLLVYLCYMFTHSDDNSVGPVSSLHDRACELFYSLVGGTGEGSSSVLYVRDVLTSVSGLWFQTLYGERSRTVWTDT